MMMILREKDDIEEEEKLDPLERAGKTKGALI
jgi:hypothetical protein